MDTVRLRGSGDEAAVPVRSMWCRHIPQGTPPPTLVGMGILAIWALAKKVVCSLPPRAAFLAASFGDPGAPLSSLPPRDQRRQTDESFPQTRHGAACAHTWVCTCVHGCASACGCVSARACVWSRWQVTRLLVTGHQTSRSHIYAGWEGGRSHGCRQGPGRGRCVLSMGVTGDDTRLRG